METTTDKVKILSAGAIAAMLRRMAYEMYERNFGESQLVLAGIGPRGGFMADRLEVHLREISPLKLLRVDFAKGIEGNTLSWSKAYVAESFAGKPIIIVDDVLYSGSTVLHALVLAAAYSPTKIQTAFLIDRGHHQFPIAHDYVGMEMATSLKQYIGVEVDISTDRAEAFIF